MTSESLNVEGKGGGEMEKLKIWGQRGDRARMKRRQEGMKSKAQGLERPWMQRERRNGTLRYKSVRRCEEA